LYQEGETIQWEGTERKPLTITQKLGILLNLPAVLMAAPIVVVFFRESDLALLYVSLPFVPLVWYGIGRWIDRLLGYIPPLRRIRRTWRGLFTFLSAGLLCISVVTVTPLNHHRERDTYWNGAALILWSSLAVAISGFRPQVDS
jgi:hypothetical protein